MRTIIFVLISFILVITFQQCNNSDDNLITNKSNQLIKDTIDSDPKPCCNTSRPIECIPEGYKMGINTECGEIEITCECCRDIYAYYGNPDNLLYIVIPCFEPGVSGCLPNEE